MFPNYMHFPFVDVRDVAKAHLLGIKKPEAANKRFILCADSPTFFDMFESVMTKYKQEGWPITEPRATSEDPNYKPLKFNNAASIRLGVNYTNLS